MTWAFEQDVQPTGAKFVLVCLADHADAEGYCYPSQVTLAQRTGQSERAVRGHLATLEAAGYIVRHQRRDRHGHRTSDGFWLVGYKALPAESAANQPATVAARGESLPAESAEPTGNYRQSLPADSAAYIKANEPPVEPPMEPPVLTQRARERPRDELFDALLECWLPGQSHRDLAKPERGKINAAAAALREIGATPDEIRLRWQRMQASFRSAAYCTPNALAANWTSLGRPTDERPRHTQQPGAPQRRVAEPEFDPVALATYRPVRPERAAS